MYALEVLLLIKRHASRAWHASDLVRDLRSSRTAVAEALQPADPGRACSRKLRRGATSLLPSSPAHAKLAADIEKIYIRAPMSAVTAIVAVPDK